MAKVTPLSKKILIVAGDVSGDLHAASLMKELKKADPEVQITAVGGKLMQAQADHFLFDLASQGASGFVEPLKKMPLWMNLMKQIRHYMETENPSAVIVVDFYGFNHQVLNMASHRGIPAYYYVTPQVWASRQYRAKQLAKLTKKMFVIYPFEPEFHKKFGGNAVFLGNPLLDIMPLPQEPEKTSITDVKNKVWKLGILPGSRRGEITRLLPVFYQTFKQVAAHYPQTHAYLFALPQADDKQLLSLLGETPHPHFHLVKEADYKQRAQMDYLLACSGTATLENALLGVPMLVAYKMFYPTYLVARCVVKVKDISLVNILAGKRLVPELIQQDATAGKCAQETLEMFSHPQKLTALHNELLQLRASLGEPGVAERAAKDILKELSK